MVMRMCKGAGAQTEFLVSANGRGSFFHPALPPLICDVYSSYRKERMAREGRYADLRLQISEKIPNDKKIILIYHMTMSVHAFLTRAPIQLD